MDTVLGLSMEINRCAARNLECRIYNLRCRFFFGGRLQTAIAFCRDRDKLLFHADYADRARRFRRAGVEASS